MKLVDVEQVYCAECEYKDRCAEIFCDVHRMPTVDPSDVLERKRGEWRTVKLNRDKGTVLVECSECGCVFDLTLFACGLNYNFCPNCGCLMGGD